MASIEKVSELIKDLRELSPFSKGTLHAGFILMLGCYLCGIYALWLAPTAINFSGTMQMAEGFFEAGPACLAAAVCVALLCDLVIKRDLAEK